MFIEPTSSCSAAISAESNSLGSPATNTCFVAECGSARVCVCVRVCEDRTSVHTDLIRAQLWLMVIQGAVQMLRRLVLVPMCDV